MEHSGIMRHAAYGNNIDEAIWEILVKREGRDASSHQRHPAVHYQQSLQAKIEKRAEMPEPSRSRSIL
jgi:hypothetical protein